MGKTPAVSELDSRESVTTSACRRVDLLLGRTPCLGGSRAGSRWRIYAGEAFHIAHGFGIDPAESHAVGQFDFRLDIDGEDQGKGKLLTTGVGYDVDPFAKGEMTRVFLYNFEDGLDTDTYTFTGHWSASCRTAMESFGYPGPCPQENSQVQLLTFSLSVTFK